MSGEQKFNRMWRRQAGRCHYCTSSMVKTRGLSLHPMRASFDHIVPRSKGGTNDDWNLVLACQVCNGLKGSLSYDEFLERLPELRSQGPHAMKLETLLALPKRIIPPRMMWDHLPAPTRGATKLRKKARRNPKRNQLSRLIEQQNRDRFNALMRSLDEEETA